MYFLHSFLFYSLRPFPFSCSFCFLTCSQLPLSLLLLSSISVRHISFTQLLMLTPPQPELNGQGERSELGLLPCREQQAAPREAGRLCWCVCTDMCVRETQAESLQHSSLPSASLAQGKPGLMLKTHKLRGTDGYSDIKITERDKLPCALRAPERVRGMFSS